MAAKKKKILLTNDDGYFSEGINVLYRELSRKNDVSIVAPDREQSASSHSLTLERPLRFHRVNDYTYTTDGTPTDCVMLAVHRLFRKRRPDMIVSGINHGANMGDDITYSGTIAAAIEGSILKIPSVAASMVDYVPGMSMGNAARFVARFVAGYDKLDLDPATFININFPPDNGRPYEAYAYTRQGFREYQDIVIRKTDPRGKPYYWIGGKAKWKATRGSDFAAVKRGAVSITPLKLNFTDLDSLDQLRRNKNRK
jgi:5'-nucleotidase